MGRTLFEKIWDTHVVTSRGEDSALLYIDLHLIHEVTSPQAFEGLRINSRKVRRPDLTLATADHNVPTENIDQEIADPISRQQIDALRSNTTQAGIELHDMGEPGQGIVHVIGPEQGRTLPGMTIVCGDSHTSTHGAFGALAFGIGTSEVEHVLASQTLPQAKPKTMAINLVGTPPPDITAKDLVLKVIREIGTGGGAGHVIEYRGEAFTSLSMEGRMTVANMSIEAGARAGLFAPDQTTFAYLQDKVSMSEPEWEEAVSYWRTLVTDDDAVFDKVIEIDVTGLEPQVSWGTNPGQAIGLSEAIPNPDAMEPDLQSAAQQALTYMGLEPGQKISEVKVDTVFIGSCTNSRIEDIRAAAQVVKGHTIAAGVRALVVPGSAAVKKQAEQEGLDQALTEAGFDWRQPGCSMCLAMNPDKLTENERCASTSNRNFEGRQGKGGRTHLVSPAVAAATAIAGKFCRPQDLGADL